MTNLGQKDEPKHRKGKDMAFFKRSKDRQKILNAAANMTAELGRPQNATTASGSEFGLDAEINNRSSQESEREEFNEPETRSSNKKQLDSKSTTAINTETREAETPTRGGFKQLSELGSTRNINLPQKTSSPLRHQRLGFDDHEAISMYRTMLEARILDQKMWLLNRSGKAPFAISSQGHEATHVGIAKAIIPGVDYVLPYYRDLGLVLGIGVSPEEILLAHLAKADDKMSGGRQMPNHWSVFDKNIISGSSPIATQLPHAVGIALALRIRGIESAVFTTFGDGGASKGDFHEALNFAGIHKLGVIFICENNGYALSVPLEMESAVTDIATHGSAYNIHSVIVDGNDPLAVYEVTSKARKRAVEGLGPTLIEAKTYRFLSHTSDDDDRTYRSPEEVAIALSNDPLNSFASYLFDAQLLTEGLQQAMSDEIKASINETSANVERSPDPDPKTIKSNLFRHEIFYSTPAHQEPALPGASGIEITFIEAIRSTLQELLDEFPEAMILGEDVGKRGGVFQTTKGLQDIFGSTRILDTPLAESGLVGFGIGLSMCGMLPIVEIQFADFIHSAFDQILSEAARIHYRSMGAFHVPLVIRAPFGAGVHGGLYHSQSIEAFYSHIPGIKVVVPSTIENAAGLLRSSLKDPDPVLFLEHKRAYRSIRGLKANKGFEFPIGRAQVVRPGSDLSIITYGLMRHYALQVAESMADLANIEVIDLLTISPLDTATIVESARRCSKVLVIHEDNMEFGVGAEVSAAITEGAFYDLDAPVARLAPSGYPMAPFAPSLENAILITPPVIKDAVEKLLRA